MKTENHRVLIIDDERPVLMTLEALLKRHGYQVETAPTATQGLKVLKSKSPTLVLLDLRLPDADGLEMLERIKSELPKVQVIILTAHDSLHNAIESIKRGAYHFISKPYAPEELLSLVEKALETQFLLREASLHRSDAGFSGNDRSGKSWHPFSRRNIRYAGGLADALFAGAPGARVSAARQHANNESRLPRDCFD